MDLVRQAVSLRAKRARLEAEVARTPWAEAEATAPPRMRAIRKLQGERVAARIALVEEYVVRCAERRRDVDASGLAAFITERSGAVTRTETMYRRPYAEIWFEPARQRAAQRTGSPLAHAIAERLSVRDLKRRCRRDREVIEGLTEMRTAELVAEAEADGWVPLVADG